MRRLPNSSVKFSSLRKQQTVEGLKEIASLRSSAVPDEEAGHFTLQSYAAGRVTEYYHTNPYVRGVIDTIAADLTNINYKVYEVGADGKKEEIEPVPQFFTKKDANIASLLACSANVHQSSHEVLHEFWLSRLTGGVGLLEFDFTGEDAKVETNANNWLSQTQEFCQRADHSA